VERVNYSLKELCRAAGVTERTIRYYITEGLLPPPSGTGPFSRYGYEHWLRLQFILRLKEEYLPLNEIKNLLVDKSVTELETLAQRSGLFNANPPATGEIKESFLDLLRPKRPTENQLLRQQMTPFSLDTSEEIDESPEEPDEQTLSGGFNPQNQAKSASASGMSIPEQIYPASPPPPIPQSDGLRSGESRVYRSAPEDKKASFLREEAIPATPLLPEEPISQIWERIIVAPGIELHVESNIANQHRPALNLLLREIRRLLGK
jgi:DNA-binding transcriptional MerR regulator